MSTSTPKLSPDIIQNADTRSHLAKDCLGKQSTPLIPLKALEEERRKQLELKKILHPFIPENADTISQNVPKEPDKASNKRLSSRPFTKKHTSRPSTRSSKRASKQRSVDKGSPSKFKKTIQEPELGLYNKRPIVRQLLQEIESLSNQHLNAKGLYHGSTARTLDKLGLLSPEEKRNAKILDNLLAFPTSTNWRNDPTNTLKNGPLKSVQAYQQYARAGKTLSQEKRDAIVTRIHADLDKLFKADLKAKHLYYGQEAKTLQKQGQLSEQQKQFARDLNTLFALKNSTSWHNVAESTFSSIEKVIASYLNFIEPATRPSAQWTNPSGSTGKNSIPTKSFGEKIFSAGNRAWRWIKAVF